MISGRKPPLNRFVYEVQRLDMAPEPQRSLSLSRAAVLGVSRLPSGPNDIPLGCPQSSRAGWVAVRARNSAPTTYVGHTGQAHERSTILALIRRGSGNSIWTTSFALPESHPGPACPLAVCCLLADPLHPSAPPLGGPLPWLHTTRHYDERSGCSVESRGRPVAGVECCPAVLR